MHLMRLSYRASQLGLAYLECVQDTNIKPPLGNIINTACFINQVLTISWNSSHTVPKVKTRKGVGAQAIRPHDPGAAQQHERGPDQKPLALERSKLKEWFLLGARCSHTTFKRKNPKSNHRHSVTVYTVCSIKLFTFFKSF